MDQLISEELLNPETNRMIVSFEANTDLLAADPVKLDAVTSSLAELLGGRLSAKGIVTEYPPARDLQAPRADQEVAQGDRRPVPGEEVGAQPEGQRRRVHPQGVEQERADPHDDRHAHRHGPAQPAALDLDGS